MNPHPHSVNRHLRMPVGNLQIRNFGEAANRRLN